MKPLRIYIDPCVDESKAQGLFSPLNFLGEKGGFQKVSHPEEAHVIITNFNDDSIRFPKEALHFALYSSAASSYGVRLICPDDLMQKLLEFHKLLIQDQHISQTV